MVIPFGRTRARDRSRGHGGGWRFDPAALAPGYTLDLNPAALALSDGAQITSVPNAGSAGGTLDPGAAATRPLFKTGIANGQPSARFDGVDDYLQSSVAATAILAGGAWTVIAVVKLLGLAAAAGSPWLDATLSEDTNGNLGLMVRDNAGTPQVGCYRFGGALAAYATMAGTGTLQVLCASYNGSNEGLAQRDVQTAVTAAVSGSGIAGNLRVGGYAGGANFLHGDVLRVFAWQSRLSDATREAFVRAVARHYGLSL